jgi:hypothetical protein
VYKKSERIDKTHPDGTSESRVTTEEASSGLVEFCAVIGVLTIVITAIALLLGGMKSDCYRRLDKTTTASETCL